MRMADGGQFMHHRTVLHRPQSGEDRPAGIPGRVVVGVEHVADVVQIVEQLARPGRVQRRPHQLRRHAAGGARRLRRFAVGFELAQHVEIVEQRPGVRIEAADLASRELVGLGGRMAGFGGAEGAVAGNLNIQSDRLAAPGRPGQRAAWRPLLRPWVERPSSQSRASERESQWRSTCDPRQPSGMRKLTRAQ